MAHKIARIPVVSPFKTRLIDIIQKAIIMYISTCEKAACQDNYEISNLASKDFSAKIPIFAGFVFVAFLICSNIETNGELPSTDQSGRLQVSAIRELEQETQQSVKELKQMLGIKTVLEV